MADLARSYEKVLVLGNGFDLNLGLKTKYSDFIQSEEFQVLIQPNNFFAHLIRQQNLNNWIDIEAELKEYSRSVNDKNFESDYYNLCNALMDYISKISYDEIDRSSIAYQLIKEVTAEDFIVFDFNYTETFEHLALKTGFKGRRIGDRIVKVHGSAKEQDIIFGVEEGASIKPENIFLKKAFPPHYKGINLGYHLDTAKEVHFFGHSLGETDHNYFQHFFQRISTPSAGFQNQKKIINLYYYGMDAYKDLHIQLDKLTLNRLGSLKNKNEFNPIPIPMVKKVLSN